MFWEPDLCIQSVVHWIGHLDSHHPNDASKAQYMTQTEFQLMPDEADQVLKTKYILNVTTQIICIRDAQAQTQQNSTISYK